jgi:hypothetical protein
MSIWDREEWRPQIRFYQDGQTTLEAMRSLLKEEEEARDGAHASWWRPPVVKVESSLRGLMELKG